MFPGILEPEYSVKKQSSKSRKYIRYATFKNQYFQGKFRKTAV